MSIIQGSPLKETTVCLLILILTITGLPAAGVSITHGGYTLMEWLAAKSK
jgi:hypothetical protein